MPAARFTISEDTYALRITIKANIPLAPNKEYGLTIKEIDDDGNSVDNLIKIFTFQDPNAETQFPEYTAPTMSTELTSPH